MRQLGLLDQDVDQVVLTVTELRQQHEELVQHIGLVATPSTTRSSMREIARGRHHSVRFDSLGFDRAREGVAYQSRNQSR